MKKIHKLAVLCAVLALTFSFTTVAYAYSDDAAGTVSSTNIGTSSNAVSSVTTSPAKTAASSSSVSSAAASSSSSGTSNPFTPAGTGTVVNTATDTDGKEFYTITTPDKNVFYLVIDRQRDGDNVYFLNAVTEKDLLALAEKSGSSAANTGTNTTTASASSSSTQTTTSQTGTETPVKSSSTPQSNNMGMLLLVLAVVVIGGGAGYYFKIYRPKHQRADSEDELDYSDENGSDIAEDSEQSDELPPSEDEGDESDGDGEV